MGQWVSRCDSLSTLINTIAIAKTINYITGLKGGQMTWTIWVAIILVGQVGLIHKLNYLDVTCMHGFLIDHMLFYGALTSDS